MKLAELRPRWLEYNGRRIAIMFLCPHCVAGQKPEQWLTCFFVPAATLPPIVSEDEFLNGERCERLLYEQAFREMGYADPLKEAWEIVSCKPNCQWVRTSDDFATMSIMPSIDASASGHWHGFVTAGEVT